MSPQGSIFLAIEYGVVEWVRDWIAYGAVNKWEAFLGGPLDYAIKKNKPEIVRIILEAGGKQLGFLNVLQVAVETDDDDVTILKLLVEHGYDQFGKYDYPINMACLKNRPKKLEFLLTHFNLDIDKFKGIQGATGLYFAIKNNNADTVTLLIKYGAESHLIVNYDVLDKCMPIIDYARQFHPAMYEIIQQSVKPTLTKRARHVYRQPESVCPADRF